MTTELRDVLSEPVEIRGGLSRVKTEFVSFGSEYRNVGGYAVSVFFSGSGVGRVQIRQNGMNSPTETADFEYADEARTEFDRLVSLLTLKDQVASVVTVLVTKTSILPVEFVPNVKAGEFEALLIAADFCDERDEADKAMLLRSAYYRLTAQANVTVKVNKKTTIVYNPQEITKRYPLGLPHQQNIGNLTAVVVTAGESVRIIALNTNTFKPVTVEVREFKIDQMAEYGSFNLVYFGPVMSITAKTVVVAEKNYGRSVAPKHRLTLAKFVEKNRDFDLAAAEKRNDSYMD